MHRTAPFRRWLLRLTLASVLALGLGYLPYRAYGPGGVARTLRLQEQLLRLEQRIDRLREENQDLSRAINKIKSDRAAIELVAQDELGLVRPDDIVFQFEASP